MRVKPYCVDCKKEFLHYQTYLQHQKSQHKRVRYPCEDCGQAYTRRGNLNHHILRAHPETLSSDAIKLLKSQWAALRNQKRSKTNNWTSPTEKPINHDRRRPAFLRQVVKKPKVLEVTPAAQSAKKRQPNPSPVAQLKRVNLACVLCPFVAPDAERMKIHSNRHKGTHLHKCSFCSFGCQEQASLAQHMSAHFGCKSNCDKRDPEGKPVEDVKLSCLYCGCCFGDRKQLYDHEAMHR